MRQGGTARNSMPAPADQPLFCTKDDGYRGIWHGQTPTEDEYVYKYSGGLGTYPNQHRPFAVYSAAAQKTFFCYGGTPRDSYRDPARFTGGHAQYIEGQLLHMVSYYDHTTGTVPRPTILFDKWTGDAHDNPVIALDAAGYIWIFSPSHGDWTTPSFMHRSVEPYSIDRFETVSDDWLFAYPQPWYVPGRGFIFMHTNYHEGRRFLYSASSPDGRTWSESRLLARAARGHYQISGVHGDKVGTAFDYHPEEGGLEARTNIYYMESTDGGQTWQTAGGAAVTLPITEPDNPALVHDYEAEGLKAYIKDLVFDANGHPIIVYILTRGPYPGPQYGPRTWVTARWTGAEWSLRPAMISDNHYDMGPLYIEPDGWRLIGPTEPGPQPHNPGGEMAVWFSPDEGETWDKLRTLTADSARNHTFARRPVDAHPDFYAFWADGDARQPSESHLYFTNRAGDAVWRLPVTMTGDFAEPERYG